MGTSVYFNNFSPSVINENRLLEDLIVESVQIMGHDVQYMPRETYDSMDSIYGEDPESKFTRAYRMEMYISNVEGYEGDGDFFSKFGLEIRDTSNFVVARRSFEKYVDASVITRPREGDLIFVPLMHRIFEIKFVEEEMLFFSLGKRDPFMYELRAETFRYSQENLQVGIEEIDDIERDSSYAIRLTMGSGSGNYTIGETVYQGANLTVAAVTAEASNWNPTTKLLDVINISGTFTDATDVTGTFSNTTYNMTSSEDKGDYVPNDEWDNLQIQTEADVFVDISEVNPFGQP
jgi:hypothetical protein